MKTKILTAAIAASLAVGVGVGASVSVQNENSEIKIETQNVELFTLTNYWYSGSGFNEIKTTLEFWVYAETENEKDDGRINVIYTHQLENDNDFTEKMAGWGGLKLTETSMKNKSTSFSGQYMSGRAKEFYNLDAGDYVFNVENYKTDPRTTETQTQIIIEVPSATEPIIEPEPEPENPGIPWYPIIPADPIPTEPDPIVEPIEPIEPIEPVEPIDEIEINGAAIWTATSASLLTLYLFGIGIFWVVNKLKINPGRR